MDDWFGVNINQAPAAGPSRVASSQGAAQNLLGSFLRDPPSINIGRGGPLSLHSSLLGPPVISSPKAPGLNFGSSRIVDRYGKSIFDSPIRDKSGVPFNLPFSPILEQNSIHYDEAAPVFREPARGSELLDIDKLAQYADVALERKYPNLSRSLVYPLRKQHLPMLVELHKKIINSQSKKQADYERRDEIAALDNFYHESSQLGREQMKNYTLLNRGIDHRLPLVVKNALLSLKLYKQIPIINGVLMAPYQYNSMSLGGKSQKIWEKGKLARLNNFKLRALLALNPKMKELMDTKKIKTIPEYKILRTYITNPHKLGMIASRLQKEQRDFKNPKKMAGKLFRHVKQLQQEYPNLFASDLYKSKFLAASDFNNYRFLSSVLDENINLRASNKHKIEPYLDKLLQQERLPESQMKQSYKYFAPQYLDLVAQRKTF